MWHYSTIASMCTQLCVPQKFPSNQPDYSIQSCDQAHLCMPLPHLHNDCSRVSPKASVGSQKVHLHCRNIGHYPRQSLQEMVQNLPWKRGTDENTSRSRNSSKLMWKLPSCGEHSEPAVAPDGCPESQHLTDNGGLLKPKVVVTHTAPLTSSAVKDLHCTFVDAVGAVQIQTNWVRIVDGGNCVCVCVCVCV